MRYVDNFDQANALILLNALRAADGQPAVPPGVPLTPSEYVQRLNSTLLSLASKGMDVAAIRKGLA